MAQITDYASLKVEVANWLNRTDLTADIPGFIQNAEAELQRDDRARKLLNRGTINVSADNVTIASDFDSVQSWYHDGPTYYFPLKGIDFSEIPSMKLRHGKTGVPRFYAMVDGVAVFAPAPDASYATRLIYWRSFESLSDTNQTNWLITESPDIYLYASMEQAERFLKNIQAATEWEAKKDRALNALVLEQERASFSGRLARRSVRPIGG